MPNDSGGAPSAQGNGGPMNGPQTGQEPEVAMTGTIRTIRVDKGFGFIKDEAGQEYFFHRSAVYGEGLEDLRRATASNSTSARDRRALGPKTSDARPPSGLSTLNKADGPHESPRRG